MSNHRQRATLIRAARIHTLAGSGTPPVRALLVRGGRVEAVGDPAELARRAPDHETLDLGQATITPGLTDAHVHLVEWAVARQGVDLMEAASPADAARRVAEHAAGSPDEWIQGRGWEPHRWSEAPHRDHLDRVVPDRPVLLQSHDMHSLWANGVALERAGIGPGTPDPEGGRIERDTTGRPTGIVRDNAMPLVLGVAPTPGRQARWDALVQGQAVLHRWGITGVHTVEPHSLELLEAFRAADRLRLRVLQHLPLTALDDARRVGLRSGFGGPWIRIGGIKMFLDGALGSRTAWLRAPYVGTDDRGVATLDADAFRDAVARGSAAGLAMTVHAIGDAATDLALDVLGAAPLEGPVPHRIEHAQLLGLDRLGLDGDGDGPGGPPDPALRRVVASVQPSHLMTDWRAADRHWGDRSRGAFAFRSLEAAGCTLALGSDAPVEPPDPRQGLYAAIERRDLDGEPAPGWYPEERLSPERALAGYTVGPARAAGDPRQGRLGPGSFADLVAWDADPVDARGAGILGLRPRLTMVDGEVVWTEE